MDCTIIGVLSGILSSVVAIKVIKKNEKKMKKNNNNIIIRKLKSLEIPIG